MKKLLFIVLIAISGVKVNAQETDFVLSSTLVSSYVWRGGYVSGTSIQPAMGWEAGHFSLSAWGSVDISGAGYKEVDLTASYSVLGYTLSLTDYWCAGEGAYRYYMYESHRTDHQFEAGVSYTLPCRVLPLSLSWNTMVAGADAVRENGKRSYSTYIEAGYPFEIGKTDLNLSLAFTPWEGLYASGCAVVDIGLKASKSIRLTDSFSLPVFGQLITHPGTEDVFFVFGISIEPQK